MGCHLDVLNICLACSICILAHCRIPRLSCVLRLHDDERRSAILLAKKFHEREKGLGWILAVSVLWQIKHSPSFVFACIFFSVKSVNHGIDPSIFIS